MRTLVTNFIDFFYPIFRKFLPLQTFRYAACGGFNTVLGLTIYTLGLYYFGEQNVSIYSVVLKPHNAALFISSLTSLIVGFTLNKYVVFLDSYLKGRIQLLRYALSFFVNLVLNYFLLRLFVEFLGMDELLSQVLSTIIVITFSYLTQKHFTFKSRG